MEPPGPASIGKMKPAKRRQREMMSMVDDGLGDVDQRIAPTYPPVTEIPIFRDSK
jgi:hypothetical protein